MNKKDYIGIQLAKHLHEKGFDDGICDFWFTIYEMGGEIRLMKLGEANDRYENGEKYIDTLYPAYSYYQILTSLSEELFGMGEVYCYQNEEKRHDLIEEYKFETITRELLRMLQKDTSQEQVDKFIMDNLQDKLK